MGTRQPDALTAARISTQLYTATHADIVRRMPKGHKLILAPGTILFLCRLKDGLSPAEADHVRPENLLLGQSTSRWNVIAHFTELVGRLLGQAAGLERLEDWGVATMPYVVSNALSYAGRLLTQLGIPLEKEHLTPLAWHFDVDAPLGLAQARGVQHKYTIKLAETMRSVALDDRRSTALLRLSLQPSKRIWLERLDAQGNVLGRESLRRFLRKASLPLLSEMAGELRYLLDCKKECEDAALQGTATAARRIRSAVKTACARRSCVRVLLAATRLKGAIPLSIWLYLNPDGRNQEGSAACVLSVHRSLQEFVLQGPPPESRLCYFPPVVLVARLVFTAKGVSVCHPLVRQPAGGYTWCHPYTGPLAPEAFAPTAAEVEYEPALCSASTAAIRLFPGLAARATMALENNLCLAAQPERMQQLIRTFMSGSCAIEAMDVLGLVEGMHSIAKLGLTCGHQLNTGTPRARLETMPYQLHSRDLRTIDAPFTKRVFPYDPRQCRGVVA